MGSWNDFLKALSERDAELSKQSAAMNEGLDEILRNGQDLETKLEILCNDDSNDVELETGTSLSKSGFEDTDLTSSTTTEAKPLPDQYNEKIRWEGLNMMYKQNLT